MRNIRWLVVLAAAGILSACSFVQPVQLKASATPTAAKLPQVKRVAIMPFFNANGLGSDDPDPAYKGKYADMVPTTIIYRGVKDSTRFSFIPMDEVVSTLKKNGFEGVKLKPDEDVSIMTAMFHPDRYRTGFTMQEALKTGKDLHADAILIGALGMSGNAPANMRYVMSLRLVDPATGEVIWGSAQAEEVKSSLFHPIDTYTQQMQSMAQTLLAEVP